jgi:alkanesulfonate monooxygenase SsuD/methylene tetrahydromethanopterin reductase-like flavin-dependent oxidoreductase (luciferase family)
MRIPCDVEGSGSRSPDQFSFPEEHPMKFGIAVRNMGPQSTLGTIKTCALAAERIGYDAAFVSDHLCIPPDQTEGSGGRYLDVLATLAFIAGATERIRL